MTIYNPEGTHRTYTETDRHYHPRSERYTGADSLLTAQRNGWHIVDVAYREDFLLRGGRVTTVYHFKLVRYGETMLMPIVNNPFVTKMLHRHRIAVRPYPSQAHIAETQEVPQPKVAASS